MTLPQTRMVDINQWGNEQVVEWGTTLGMGIGRMFKRQGITGPDLALMYKDDFRHARFVHVPLCIEYRIKMGLDDLIRLGKPDGMKLDDALT